MYVDVSSSDSTSDEDEPSLAKKIRNYIALKKSNNWEKRCYNEIPSDSLTKIIQLKYPTLKFGSYADVPNDEMWKACYNTYRKWKTFAFQNMSIIAIAEFPIVPQETRISCTAVWSNILSIGTTNGLIIIYNLSNLNIPKFELEQEGGEITQMVFWKSNIDRLLLVSLSASSEVNFWDIKNKKKFNMTDTEVFVRNLCVGTADNLFLENNGMILDYKIESINDKKLHEDYASIQIPLEIDEKIVKMYSERHQMLIISIRGIYMRLFNLLVPTLSEPTFVLIKKSPYIELFNVSDDIPRSYEFYISSMNLVIGFFDDAMGFLTTKNYNWHLHISKLCKNIQSAVMNSNIFIVGTKEGAVQLFPIDDDNIFVSHIDKYWSRTIKLAKRPIISVNITNFNDKPHIIASTKRKVFIVWPVKTNRQYLLDKQSATMM